MVIDGVEKASGFRSINREGLKRAERRLKIISFQNKTFLLLFNIKSFVYKKSNLGHNKSFPIYFVIVFYRI